MLIYFTPDTCLSTIRLILLPESVLKVAINISGDYYSQSNQKKCQSHCYLLLIKVSLIFAGLGRQRNDYCVQASTSLY